MAGNTVLFLLTTFHNCGSAPFVVVLSRFSLTVYPTAALNVYRVLHAYIMQPLDSGIMGPVNYLEDFSNWDAYAYAIILPLVTWTADFLVVSPNSLFPTAVALKIVW